MKWTWTRALTERLDALRFMEPSPLNPREKDWPTPGAQGAGAAPLGVCVTRMDQFAEQPIRGGRKREMDNSDPMSPTVHAIYKDGVFRPLKPVNLPEDTAVEFEPRVVTEEPQAPSPPMSEGLAKIYEVLGRRYRSGFSDTAARHNEHQPCASGLCADLA